MVFSPLPRFRCPRRWANRPNGYLACARSSNKPAGANAPGIIHVPRYRLRVDPPDGDGICWPTCRRPSDRAICSGFECGQMDSLPDLTKGMMATFDRRCPQPGRHQFSAGSSTPSQLARLPAQWKRATPCSPFIRVPA